MAEPVNGGEEAADVASHEKGRPPDIIYGDDGMKAPSGRYPHASRCKSPKIFDKDSEKLKPFASWKEKRNLVMYPPSGGFLLKDEETVDEETADVVGPSAITKSPPFDDWDDYPDELLNLDRMEKYRNWQLENLELTFQQRRAWVVRSAWASIENVCEILSSVSVNKPQCEHIAAHFKVIGDVLKKMGLGKDFVSGQALESSTGIQTNLTFDEALVSLTAGTFDHMCDSLHTTRRWELSRKFREYIRELDTLKKLVRSDLRALPKKSKFSSGSLKTSMKEIVEARFGYPMQYRLDEFLCLLFEVLEQCEDLVLFHSGLEEVNNGRSGEKFVQIHELLYKLLELYACLDHCEGTEFGSGFLSRPDVCRAEWILNSWNSDFLPNNASLLISDNFLTINMATRIARLLQSRYHVLKTLSIELSPEVRVDQIELRKCRMMIIAALSESTSLTSLTACGLNRKEVHELCNSLRANRVLENLVISTDGPLASSDAMDLSAMLKENQGLKSFTLEFEDVSPEGVAYLGAMLTEISLDEIHLRSRGFRKVDLLYLLGLSMAYIDGKQSAILSLEDKCSSFEIWRSSLEGWHSSLEGWHSSLEGGEMSTGTLNYVPKLFVIKTLNRFSIKFADLDPDAICLIFDFLKKNKTLQVLELETDQNCGANREVVACLEGLLVESPNLMVLRVQIHEWDKCLVKHLLKPLMAEKDGEPYVNISLKQLHITNCLDGKMIGNVEFSPNECDQIVESIAWMLCTNKTLSHFSMNNAYLRASDMCKIIESLKTNKVLQVLHFDDFEWTIQVKGAFIDLLVNYNFTISTISLQGWSGNIGTFMVKKLTLDTKISLKQLRSLVPTTSNSPILQSAHDLKQAVGTLELEEGEVSIKEVYGSSKTAFDKHEAKGIAKDERPQLFLSYSKEMRSFAMQLCMKLKSSNYNVLDQDSINFAKIVDQCQLVIVVLSDMYVNSNSSMSELSAIVKSKKTNNPTLKVYPLFYKLTLEDLQNACLPNNSSGEIGMFLDVGPEKKALNFLYKEKGDVSQKALNLVNNLILDMVDIGKFCEEFSELQRKSWPSSGLEFEKNVNSEEQYLHSILEEIFHYMPTVMECNTNQISSHQGKLEVESKLSLKQMKIMLESLPMTNFFWQRKFNMAQYLQEKYIHYSSFEEMCPLGLSHDQKYEYSKGRIAAALFPATFLYHFKVHMFPSPYNGNFQHMLKTVASLTVEKMQKICNKNGIQTSTFFDFVDYGAPLDPKRTIAMCQNFSTKTLDGSKQLVVVQDDLTKAYYYQCDETTNLGNPTLNDSIGVIGVQVTSTEIHIDNIHEDGSSYFGVLEDFSYKFDFDKNKQCAAKAFGDLAGARFLSKNSGIKCSPLLVIALASAIQMKGLTLTWSNGQGHMEFYPKLAQKVTMEVEACACQIQYTSNITQLGLEIEWGTGTNDCVPYNQTIQRRTNEIVNQQVIGSNVDQNVGTSPSKDDGTTNTICTTKMQNDIAFLDTLAQYKSKRSGAIKVGGTGIDFGYEKHDSNTKQVIGDVFHDTTKQWYASKGGFCKIPNLDIEYPDLENRLLRCQLHEVHDHNYLVVYNVSKARHISIYEAIEQNKTVPKLELSWISDIPIDDGEAHIKDIFETGLKGRELIVRRDGSNFVQLEEPSKPLETIVPRYQESLLKLKSTFSNNAITTSMIPIPVPNLVGILKSRNEWIHIIGPQEKYEASNKYWWKATSMEAIVYSRTMYTSGKMLTIDTQLHFDGIGHFGYCSVEEGPKELKHLCGSMVSRGKFSRPPRSLLDNKVLWGGLDIEP